MVRTARGLALVFGRHPRAGITRGSVNNGGGLSQAAGHLGGVDKLVSAPAFGEQPGGGLHGQKRGTTSAGMECRTFPALEEGCGA